MTEPLILRDYQERDVAALRAQYAAGRRAVLYQLATAGGKTVVFATVVSAAAEKGHRTAVMVHRRELVRQASAKLDWAGVPHGIIAAEQDRDHDAPVQVCSIQTAIRRADTLGLFDFVVIDECHHARAATWHALLAAQRKAKLLGVTATPARTDGKGLGIVDGGLFDAMVCGPSMAELVKGGWLAPARCFVPSSRIDTKGLRTHAGDYVLEALAERARAVTGDAIIEYRRRASGQSAIAFCCTVAHAEDVATAFREAGLRSACVHGGMGMAERDALINGLADGSVEVLTSCDLISEGLDVPSVGAVILLRPTKSLVLCLQQIGRGMRPSAGKAALVVQDHAGNTLLHGLPEEERAWSLAGVPLREKAAGEEPSWICSACDCLNPMSAAFCIDCDAPRPAWGRKEPPKVDGDLVEAKVGEYAHITRLPYFTLKSRPRTRAELHAYARAHHYKRGWIEHFMREQQKIFQSGFEE